jgi:hypothetical protein
MKNITVLSGRLPAFNGTYTPAKGESKSRINWAINVQLKTKLNNEQYYDEGLVNFTAWGFSADLLNEIMSLDKTDEKRKAFSAVSVSGRFAPGYYKKNEEGEYEYIVSPSMEVAEVEFNQRLSLKNSGEHESAAQASATKQSTGSKPSNRPGNRPGSKPPARSRFS